MSDPRDLFRPRAQATPSPWYRIRAEASDRVAVIDLYDVIDSWFGVDAADFVRDVRALDVDEIQLHINCPGGVVWDGIAIRNALRQHPARVVVTVDGVAASAASFIAVCGDELVMAANSELMIHNAWGVTIGDSDDMAKAAERLAQVNQNVASMYAAKAGGEVDVWLDAMKVETWYSAEEAVVVGLADRVDDAEPADDKTKNRFDLSVFAYAGRREAPPPGVGRPRALSVAYDVGDRVQVAIDPPHAEGQSTGTVAEIGTTAYGIVFDAMPEMGVHRWYVASELEPAQADDGDESDDDEMSATKKPKKKKPMKPMPGMSAPHAPAASASGSSHKERSTPVAFTDAQLTTLRNDLGLAADADEDKIVSTVVEVMKEFVKDDTPVVVNKIDLPEGTVAVDKATLDELRATAELGRAAHNQQQTERRERIVNAAVQDGRIAPARRDAWLNQLAADPGAEETLAGLAKGLIPVDGPIGHAGNDASNDTDEDALFRAVFGDEQKVS